MTSTTITTLFLDIGGVVLTNGWDHTMRQAAAETFGLDYEEMNERHHLTFDTYELGKLTLEAYLNRVVFHTQRPFSRDEFRAFMFEQSEPYPDMIELIRGIKNRFNLTALAVSNEGRELTVYRVKRFELHTFIDVFISSCFVHFRKPDEDMYRMALDIAQTPAEQVLYVDDRPMFVEVARGVGVHGIVHTDYKSTRAALKAFGFDA